MKLTKINLSELKAPEKNVRIHSDKQINEFIRSIDMFDQIRPIVVDENYTILAGNGLYAALTAMGRTEADCYIIKGLSENEKKKLMLADNKIFNLGVDDMEAFEDILAELDGDLDIPGYDTELLETLTADSGDVDELMSGYGIVSESTKEQIAATAKRYEDEENGYIKTAEAVSPAAQTAASPANTEPAPEKLERRYIECPKCGERIWI